MASLATRFCKYLSIVLVALLCLALVILTFHPTIRHAALSIFQGLYETQRQYSIRRFLAEPDFEVIVPRLQRQLDIVQAFGSDNSQLSVEFIETMAKVMVNARSETDFQNLKPLLKRLVALEPRAYLPQLWLATATLELNESGASKEIERAIALMPADDRAHRLALKLALRRGDDSSIGRLCSRWEEAQQGGITIPDHFGLFDGQSLRRMAVQIKDLEGNTIVSANSALELGSRRRYEFRFDGEVAIDEFTLWLAVFPGTRLQFHNIELLDGEAWHAIELESVSMLPSHGFLGQEDIVVFGHRGNQKITFALNGVQLDNSSSGSGITGIALDATFDKLQLVRARDCI